MKILNFINNVVKIVSIMLMNIKFFLNMNIHKKKLDKHIKKWSYICSIIHINLKILIIGIISTFLGFIQVKKFSLTTKIMYPTNSESHLIISNKFICIILAKLFLYTKNFWKCSNTKNIVQ